MNECKVCGNECTGKTCSGSCRAKLSRAHGEAHAHGLTEEAHGQAHALDMAELVDDWAGDNCQCGHCSQSRHNGHNGHNGHNRRLNHGTWLTADQLEASDFDGNRVAIPGDVDYVGTCKG